MRRARPRQQGGQGLRGVHYWGAPHTYPCREEGEDGAQIEMIWRMSTWPSSTSSVSYPPRRKTVSFHLILLNWYKHSIYNLVITLKNPHNAVKLMRFYLYCYTQCISKYCPLPRYQPSASLGSAICHCCELNISSVSTLHISTLCT